MKRKEKLLVVIMGLALLAQSTTTAIAAPVPTDSAGNKALISSCATTLPPLYSKELSDFLAFLDQNFKNKSSNTSLTNIAIQRYAEYKKNIKAIFAQLGPAAYGLVDGEGGLDVDKPKSVDNSVELAAYKNCQDITEQYLVSAKDQMMERIKSSASQKSATLMIEKYKAINMQLRELNIQIAKMYALFMTFANKLPGFVKECIS